jgi:hypothetical protein
MDTDDDPGPAVGLTGARFRGVPRQRRPERDGAEGPGPDGVSEEQPDAGPAAAGAVPAVAPDAPAPEREEEPGASGVSFVRPYVFTGGRTRSSVELSIETLVSAAPQPPSTRLSGAHEVVLGLCRESRSVAELAAGAGVPLGVARVLVGDLAAAGAVMVHRSAGAGGPDLALMDRVLSGLRRL